jgi:hypothetical protein
MELVKTGLVVASNERIEDEGGAVVTNAGAN